MTLTPAPQGVEDTYGLSNAAVIEATQRLSVLSNWLDPLSAAHLDRAALPADARCLEIGAGNGSFAAILADRVGPAGAVTAADIDPRHITAPGVRVVEHDIREGVPDGGPFDLIHARLLLLHLPKRRIIMRQLVDALAPNGWLVVGEFDASPLHVYRAPSLADERVWQRLDEALRAVLGGHGADLSWAAEVPSAMAEAGLTNVYTSEHAESWPGGSPRALLHAANAMQIRGALLEYGITEAEYDRYLELTADPAFVARSYRFVVTSGQRPA